MSKSNYSIDLEDQLRIMNAQLDQLELENKRLVDQLKEVIRMNTHWQRYDSQREEYVMKLTRTNQELQDKVSDLQRQVSEINKDLKMEVKKERPRAECTESLRDCDSEEYSTEQKAATSSSASVSTSTCLRKEEIAALTDHVAKLKVRICELESGRVARQKHDEDQVALLREQVNVCVEDFRQERKDRERCHEENFRLKERLAQTENDLRANEEQLYVYQEQIKQLQERRRYHQDPTPARRAYDEPCCCPEEHRRYQNHRRSTRQTQYYGDDLTELPQDVEIDGVPEGPHDEIDGVLDAPSAGPSDTNGETHVDQCDGKHEASLKKCDGLTELSRNVEVDRVPEAPHDEIDGVLKAPNNNNVEIDQPDGDHEAPLKKCDGQTCSNSAEFNLQTLHSTDREILKEKQPTDLISDEKHEHAWEPGADENNNDEDELQCPKCLKSFGVLKHLELLDHINTCVQNEQ